MHALL